MASPQQMREWAKQVVDVIQSKTTSHSDHCTIAAMALIGFCLTYDVPLFTLNETITSIYQAGVRNRLLRDIKNRKNPSDEG